MKVLQSFILRLLVLEFLVVGAFCSVTVITRMPIKSDGETSTTEPFSTVTVNTTDDLIIVETPTTEEPVESLTKSEPEFYNGTTLNESQKNVSGIVATQKKPENIENGTEMTTSSLNTTTEVQSEALKTINRKQDNPPPSRSKLDSTIIGTLIVGAVIVIIIIISVVIIIYVMHIWRVKMIQSASHPSVLYSMLRQNENEPEDQLGEILVSVGLASETDVRPSSSSETEDSSSPLPDTSIEGNTGNEVTNFTQSDVTTWNNPLVDPWDLECLSTVPLSDSDYRYRPDESDEELLE